MHGPLRKVRLKEVKVGDEILFGNNRGQGHNAVVGEVYSDRIIIYDAAYMCVNSSKNYKRTVYIPKNSSTVSDLAAVRKVVDWCGEWWIRRHYNFKSN